MDDSGLEDLRRAEPPTGIGLDLVKITDMLSRMMLEYGISALPVMDGTHLDGIISVNDIIRAYVELEQKEQCSTA